jgi:hypothetical protein
MSDDATPERRFQILIRDLESRYALYWGSSRVRAETRPRAPSPGGRTECQ